MMRIYYKSKIIVTVLITLFCSLFCITANAEEIPKNAYGVIYIPAINVKMPLYTTKINDVEHEQLIIDKENAALIKQWGTAYNIIDHAFSYDNNGNMWNIQKIFAGAYGWIYTNEHVYYLECYLTGKTNYDGNEYINNKILLPYSSHDILLSCCAEDSQHHFVAAFRRLKEY